MTEAERNEDSVEIAERVLDALRREPSLREKFLEIIAPSTYVRRDELTQVLEEIRQLRIESNQRFEAMQERFEAMDRRFEAMQRQMDERFETTQKRLDERFEAMQRQMDERFKATQKQTDELFEAMQETVVVMQADLADLTGNHSQQAEDAVRRLLSRVLETEGIETARIEHIRVKDRDGSVFGRGYTTDIGIYCRGEETWIIEYKARAKREDIIHLHLVAKLLRKQYRINPDRVLMATVKIDDEGRVLADAMDIEVLQGRSKDPRPLPPPATDSPA